MPPNEVREQWMKWKRNFDYIVAACGEKDKTKLKYLLLARAGTDVQDVFQTIPEADVTEDVENGIDPYQIPPTLQSMVQGHPSIDDTTHSLEVNDSQTRPKRTTRRPMKYDDYVEEYIE
ncbi:uncharacterized protein LOC134220305 isoform X2 [Armigeres subalbatus]|uniref:uncharacterized protein LOC134220305 isoform X2 n=1 Tax=Armigeres subalbatus TaxID=124917 RepID=UPI002ED0EE61